jgi:hypothetical protein
MNDELTEFLDALVDYEKMELAAIERDIAFTKK